MVRKRWRKKLLVPERQPLVRPMQPDEVWSMDLVFDELANGRRVKTLTVADDCSKEGRIQPFNATHSLNVSAGVWKTSVLRGLSFNCLAIALS